MLPEFEEGFRSSRGVIQKRTQEIVNTFPDVIPVAVASGNRIPIWAANPPKSFDRSPTGIAFAWRGWDPEKVFYRGAKVRNLDNVLRTGQDIPSAENVWGSIYAGEAWKYTDRGDGPRMLLVYDLDALEHAPTTHADQRGQWSYQFTEDPVKSLLGIIVNDTRQRTVDAIEQWRNDTGGEVIYEPQFRDLPDADRSDSAR
jgi:hypothetical protein